MQNLELKLPKEAFVNKFIAKAKFYEKANLNAKLQKEFVDKVQRITWMYKLAESTIGISKTEMVTEIQIFEIELKELKIPKNLLKIIDKSIPYQILYRFINCDNIAYGITLKEHTSVENYYFSGWNTDITFEFSGVDLEKVYQKLVKAFICDDGRRQESFSDIIDVDNKIKALETEISTLENSISKEKQFNRKVEMNKTLLEKKIELSEIKVELK